MLLYHRDLGIPANITRPSEGLTLSYSSHAAEQANRKNIWSLPGVLGSYTIIEVETDTCGVARKWVLRLPHSHSHDLCMAVLPSGLVKTVWLNTCEDTHRTLDSTRYERVLNQ